MIPLTRGVVAWIDDQDEVAVSGHRWHAHLGPNGRWYAKTNVPVDPTPGHRRQQTALYMHTLILETPAGMQCDHIRHRPADEKVADNRRDNLRPVTKGGNMQNQGVRRTNTGSYKGVLHQHGRLIASVWSGGKRHYLGLYQTERECGYAYDIAALYFFGATACPNFPLPGATRSLRPEHELDAAEIENIAWRVMSRLAVTDAKALQGLGR